MCVRGRASKKCRQTSFVFFFPPPPGDIFRRVSIPAQEQKVSVRAASCECEMRSWFYYGVVPEITPVQRFGGDQRILGRFFFLLFEKGLSLEN